MSSPRKLISLFLFIFGASLIASTHGWAVEVEPTQKRVGVMHASGEGMQTVAIGNELVSFGGMRDELWVEDAVIYRPATDENLKSDLSFTIRGAASAAGKKEAYVVGGEGPNGPNLQGWKLEIDSNNQIVETPLPELPRPVTLPSAAVYQGYLYLAGNSERGSSDTFENLLFRLPLGDPAATWELLPPWSLEPLKAPIFGIQNSQLFLLGDPGNGQPSRVYRLKDARQTDWDERSQAPFTLLARNGVTTGHSGLVFLFPNPSLAVEGSHSLISYNVITDRWARIGPLAGEYDLAFLESSGTTNYLIGIDNSAFVTSVYELTVGMASRPFGVVDYSIIVVYIIGLVLMGFYFSRKEKGTEDFFVGGRKVPWWAVGLSLYATGTSAISFMAISGRTYSTDWLYFMNVLFGLLLAGIIAVILVPLIRKLNVTSTYEYLELRFHVSVRLMGSLVCILTQLGSRMSVVLFLPALALSKVTGIDVFTSVITMGAIATLYTYLGGIKAVIWTDVVQVIILLGGAFFCLGYVIVHVDGGFVGFIQTAAEYEKLKIFDLRLTLEAATIWVFFLAAAAGIMTIPNDQVMMQRVLSTKDERAATNSIWTMALMTIPGNLVFFSLGTALWVFYANFPDRMDPSLQFDATFPHFVAHEFPVGIAGLVISALFAASMSTLDSGMNSVSTIITVDFYKRFKDSATDDECLRLARIITIIAGIFATIMALVLTKFSLPSLWDTMILLTGLLGGGFGGVFALGMLTRRSNAAGALAGVIVSLFVALAVRQWGDVHVFMIMPIAVFTVVFVGYTVSMFTPAHGKDLRGLTLFKVDRVPREERIKSVGH